MELNKEFYKTLLLKFENENQEYLSGIEEKFKSVVYSVDKRLIEFQKDFNDSHENLNDNSDDNLLELSHKFMFQFIEYKNNAHDLLNHINIGPYRHLTNPDIRKGYEKIMFDLKSYILNSVLMGLGLIDLDKFFEALEEYYYYQFNYNIFSEILLNGLNEQKIKLKFNHGDVFTSIMHESIFKSFEGLKDLNIESLEIYSTKVFLKSLSHSIQEKNHVLSDTTDAFAFLFDEFTKLQLIDMKIEDFLRSVHAGLLNFELMIKINLDCVSLRIELRKIANIFQQFESKYIIGTSNADKRKTLAKFVKHTFAIRKTDKTYYNINNRKQLSRLLNMK